MNESLPDEVQVMLSAWRAFFPPANEVCEGYVFTRVWLSTVGGVVSQHSLQVVFQHACSRSPGGGIPACLAGFQAHTRGGGS